MVTMFTTDITTMTTIVCVVTMFTNGYSGYCSSRTALVSHPPQKFVRVICSVNTD